MGKTNKNKFAHVRVLIPILSILAFGAAVFLLMGLRYPCYMRKVEELSLFLPTQSFLTDSLAVPGGLLTWLSAFFTQYLHSAWEGATVFALLAIAIALACATAFGLRKAWMAAAVALPAVVLLSFTNLGYAIYSMEPWGYALILPLGVLTVLLLCIASRRTGYIGRTIWGVATVGLGYPLFGFYALLASALIAISGSTAKNVQPAKRIIPVAAVAIAIWLFPQAWYAIAGTNVMPSQIYVSGLPYFAANEVKLWICYPIAFALMTALALFGKKADASPKDGGKSKKAKALAALPYAVWAAATASIFVFSRNDRSLMLALELDKAIWEQDWNRAMSIASAPNDKPTRLNTLLGYIAAMRTGVAGDKMFAMDYGWELYPEREGHALQDAVAPLLCYHTGLINYAYRWATEYQIEQGMSAERMKLMIKCALLNFEMPLAKNYLDILYNTRNHRQWAKKYLRYCNNPIEMSGDKELMAIKALMCHPNTFINDGGAFEGYIWPLIASAGEGTPQFTELQMTAALIVRDLDGFMAKMPAYLEHARRVPRHFQEAAILWASISGEQLPFSVDQQVQSRFSQFYDAFQSTLQYGAEEQREKLKGSMHDTYWYYYGFYDDIPLI